MCDHLFADPNHFVVDAGLATAPWAKHASSVQATGSVLPFAGGLSETIIWQSIDLAATSIPPKRGHALVKKAWPDLFPVSFSQSARMKPWMPALQAGYRVRLYGFLEVILANEIIINAPTLLVSLPSA